MSVLCALAASWPCGAQDAPFYEDVTLTHLPATTAGAAMDAGVADIDGDGDLDIVLAFEFERNRILLNDGNGFFEDASEALLPASAHDSEDVAIADFDGDGDLDLAFVSEDDRTNELFLNEGAGGFVAAGDRIPVAGTSNAVVVADINGDGFPDLLVGNRDRDFLLLNDGSGTFVDAPERMPTVDGVTQDLELGDVDNDGDLDVLYGSELDNRLLLNDGAGFFSIAPRRRIPLPDVREVTREADFGDVDGDGDLDIFYANVDPGSIGSPQDRLLINDGSGAFTDQTSSRLPVDTTSAFDGDLIDLDGDGDLDIVIGLAFGGSGFEALLNDGTGVFVDGTQQLFGPKPPGNGFDIEQADFNGDRLADLYLVSRFGSDRLLLATGHAPGVSCSDVKKLRVGKCRNNRIKAKLVLRSRTDSGETVSIAFDGEPIAATVRGKKAKANASDLELGDHVVRLLSPVGCVTPKVVTCSP